MQPAVSVIIPAHNAALTLAETLISVQSQTFTAWQAVVVDDASTDGTAALVQAMAQADPRITLIRHMQKPLGAAGARNLAIRNGAGRYMAFLDADDLWLPRKLTQQMRALQTGAPIVFSSYQRFADATGRILGTVQAAPVVRYRDALNGNPIGCLTGIWDTALFGPAQMPDIALREDYAFWLSLLRSGATATGLPEVLARYRVAGQSRSGNKLRAARATWAVLRAEPGLSLPRAALGFVRYGARAAWRRLPG